MLQNSVLFVHVLQYKYYCFCSLDEELGIKLETQRHPGMYTGACCCVPPMGRIRAETKAANTQNFSWLVHSNLQSTGHWTNTQTKQTSTATSNSLLTVNKAEKGAAKRLVHHHPTTSNTTGLLVHHLIWVSVSWHVSIFLLHRFLWSSGQSQPFGLIPWDLQADLFWEDEKFVFADAPWFNKARWDQTSSRTDCSRL